MLLAADRACFVAKRGGRDRIATAAEGRGARLRVLAPGADPDRPGGQRLTPSAARHHRSRRADGIGRRAGLGAASLHMRQAPPRDGVAHAPHAYPQAFGSRLRTQEGGADPVACTREGLATLGSGPQPPPADDPRKRTRLNTRHDTPDHASAAYGPRIAEATAMDRPWRGLAGRVTIVRGGCVTMGLRCIERGSWGR